jgi:HAD superfamily hydrolase (TIGR01509 family)
MSAVLLDVDGTLVDTNYHHTLAWYRAFRELGTLLPLWRIHRHIGMGGDQLVPALTDDRYEHERGDQVREAEKRHYTQLIEEVEPVDGAHELIAQLRARGHVTVLASSAKQDELAHYLDLLDARELADHWTSAADVQATKPQPDLVHVALERAGKPPADAVMLGDSPWDVKAALEAGVQTLAVITGGFSREELLDAGALLVFESVAELCDSLDQTPLQAGADVARRSF